jgi:hypothetical protein
VGTVNTSNGKRNTLPWFLALCLLSLAVLFRLAGQAIADPARSASTPAVDSHHGSGEATRPIASARRQTAPPAARGHGVSGHLNPDGYLLPSDDFSAIERRLADRVTYDERALFVMYHAAGVCSTPVKPDWRKTARSESGRTFSAWKESFCHGITTHDESLAYAAMTLESFQKRHEDWNDKSDEDGNHLIFEAVLDSDSPEDSALAADMVDVPGLDKWALGLQDVEGTTHVARLPRYQQVALQGIQCSELGGCGPNDLMTLWLCVRTPALGCQAGASLDDLWANEFAPDEIAIIARIQQRILDERSRRLAAGASTAPRDAAR